jgi:hypothetical protein
MVFERAEAVGLTREPALVAAWRELLTAAAAAGGDGQEGGDGEASVTVRHGDIALAECKFPHADAAVVQGSSADVTH